jgi:cyanate permease
MLVVGLPLAFFYFKRYRPEYYGLLPDGATVGEEEVTDTGRMIDRGVEYAAEVEEVEFTLRQAARTPAYWLLIVVSAVHAFSTTAIITHSIPFFTDIGIDILRAAGILALMALVSIPSRFIGGLITDRFEKQHLRFLMGITCLLEAVGMAVFLLNPTTAMVYVWFILRGIGTGGTLVLTSLLRARYFGRKALGSIGGFSSMFLTPLAMAAPVYIGWVHDTTGSYMSAFILLAALLAFSAVIACCAVPPKPPSQVTDTLNIV